MSDNTKEFLYHHNISKKNFVKAMLLNNFLGKFGAHDFYLGNIKSGIAKLLFTSTYFILKVFYFKNDAFSTIKDIISPKTSLSSVENLLNGTANGSDIITTLYSGISNFVSTRDYVRMWSGNYKDGDGNTLVS